MNQSNILRVDFSHFPKDGHFAQIPDKVFLADNFDETEMETIQQGRPVSKTVQMKMAIFFTCLAGEIKLDVDHRPVTAIAGQVVLILPGSFFRYISHSANAKIVFMAIAPEFLDYSKDMRLGLEFGELVKNQTVFSTSPFEIEEFLSLYKLLKRKLYDPEYAFKEAVARSVLSILECNVLSEFMRYKQQTEHETRQQTRKEELFKLFVDKVKQHFVEERSVAYYAHQLSVTPKYLSTVIHEVTGRYATDFITAFVINECKALLHTEGITIKEVTARMNFPNQSFFAKYFKQHTGMTPKEYRQKL